MKPKASGLAIMVGVGKPKKPAMEDEEAEKGRHMDSPEEEKAESDVGESESPAHADENDYPDEGGSDEGDGSEHLDQAEEHGATAFLEAVDSHDPKEVVAAFRNLYTACHLRHKQEG